MPYTYQADVWCDDCGEYILNTHPDPENEEVPCYEDPPDGCDTVYHCAAGADCFNAIDLGVPEIWLVGGEHAKVGAICTGSLSIAGIRSISEMFAEPSPTPYQQSLRELWTEEFLGEGNEQVDPTLRYPDLSHL